MDLKKEWTEIEAVREDIDMHTVFDIFCRNRSYPFHPVVNAKGYPIGIVREHDLKAYAYGRFGRELIKREPLSRFIRQTLILPHDICRDELLRSVPSNPNPDGIVITQNGMYKAVLFNDVIFNMFATSHAETQMRLVQAEKMEAIGTLAGGIAHDLNNILTPIIGYSELMLEMIDEGLPINKEMLEQIQVSGKRAQESVGRITSFSRYQKVEKQVVSLTSIIKEVLRLIGHNLPSTIDTELRIAAKCDLVFANPTEIHQVLMNLCTNAYYSMRGQGGHLQVILEDHFGPLRGWSINKNQTSEPMLRLTVSDTGTGIPTEILPKIFEPFFTTKPQGEGTGMGLSVVHGVVTRSKGMISVESIAGKGTAMHVYLPRHSVTSPARDVGSNPDNKTSPLNSAPPLSVNAMHKLRVMYVDDEYQVARLAQRYLSRLGMDVVTENDSVRAWSILETSLNEYDVVVTDQVMPSLSGIDLAKRVLNINPNFPVFICTGYNDMFTPEMVKTMGLSGYIHKPPDFTQMASLIRKSVELTKDR